MRHTADGHLDEGTLQAWLDHPRSGLSDDEVTAVEAHLSTCEVCSARAAALDEESSQVEELFGATPASAPPPFAAIEARARRLDGNGDGTSPAPERPGGLRSGGPVRRWRAGAWAASIAVALGTGWMANELFRTDPGARAGFSDESVVAPAAAPEIEMPAPPEDGEPVTTAPQTPGDATEAGAAAPTSRRAAGAPSGNTVVASPPSPRVSAEAMAQDRALDAPIASADRVLRGRVVDASSGQPLESAQVFEPASGSGALTEADGSFALEVPATAVAQGDSAVTLLVRLIGYGDADRRVALTADTAIAVPDVEMESSALKLQSLVVTGAAATGPRVALAEVDWTIAGPEAAAIELGFALRTVPELPIHDVALATVDDTRVARVRQRLPGGGMLEVVQAGRPLTVVASAKEDPAPGRSVDGVWVAVTAPGSRAVVEEWLAKVR